MNGGVGGQRRRGYSLDLAAGPPHAGGLADVEGALLAAAGLAGAAGAVADDIAAAAAAALPHADSARRHIWSARHEELYLRAGGSTMAATDLDSVAAAMRPAARAADIALVAGGRAVALAFGAPPAVAVAAADKKASGARAREVVTGRRRAATGRDPWSGDMVIVLRLAAAAARAEGAPNADLPSGPLAGVQAAACLALAAADVGMAARAAWSLGMRGAAAIRYGAPGNSEVARAAGYVRAVGRLAAEVVGPAAAAAGSEFKATAAEVAARGRPSVHGRWRRAPRRPAPPAPAAVLAEVAALVDGAADVAPASGGEGFGLNGLARQVTAPEPAAEESPAPPPEVEEVPRR